MAKAVAMMQHFISEVAKEHELTDISDQHYIFGEIVKCFHSNNSDERKSFCKKPIKVNYVPVLDQVLRKRQAT